MLMTTMCCMWRPMTRLTLTTEHVAEVIIDVTRNPNYPTFRPGVFRARIQDNHIPGRWVINVTATDQDGDSLIYSLLPSDNTVTGGTSLNYFYIQQSTGSIFLRTSLQDTTTPQFSMKVRATDNGFPPKSAEATVIIDVVKDQPPVLQPSYQALVNETDRTGTFIITITATDPDAQGPVWYEIINNGVASRLFGIDRNTGRVTVQGDLTSDASPIYVLRIRAYDSQNPSSDSTTDLIIQVNRNNNDPSFERTTYSQDVSDGTSLGTVIITVTASDRDGDRLTYNITGDSVCQQYFFIHVVRGEVILKEPLLGVAGRTINCILEVSDNGFPVSNTGNANLQVTVTGVAPPRFESSTYRITIDESRRVNSSILEVRRYVRPGTVPTPVRYELVGEYPAQDFFMVDPVTGWIRVKSPLTQDSLQRTIYTLNVTVYETASPQSRGYAQVYVTVNRNDGLPLFNPTQYNARIDETVAPNTAVITLRLTDPTGKTCSVVGTPEAVPYFRVDPSACIVRVNRPLTEDPSNRTIYTLIVEARENTGVNPRRANATVTIQVTRDLSAPRMINLPSTIRISENQDLQSTIFTVQGLDSDLKGRLQYELMGVYPARTFFGIRKDSGQVYVHTNLTADSTEREHYELEIHIYDSLFPNNRVPGRLYVNVSRNASPPRFSDNFYRADVFTSDPRGKLVLQLIADDPDGDTLLYRNLGNQTVQEYLFVNPRTGEITLNKKLPFTRREVFRFPVEVDDQRSNRLTDRAEVTVTVIVASSPAFTSTMTTEVKVTEEVNTGIHQVVARDPRDPTAVILYRMESLEPDSSYFRLTENGRLFVQRPLTDDPIKRRTQYTLIMTAYKQSDPNLSTSATFIVKVIHNNFEPVFVDSIYRGTANDYDPIGQSIVRVSAYDNDTITSPEGQLVYSLSGGENQYFSIDQYSGVISVRRILAEAPNVNTYRFLALAEDQGFDRRTSTASVIITVSHNRFDPVFDRRNYRVPVNETWNINNVLVTVSATDDDPPNTPNSDITYRIVGPPDVFSFFFINSKTGQVFARTSLSQVPNNTVESTYERTISSEEIIPHTVITLSTKDPSPKGRLLFRIFGRGLAPTYFSLNPRGDGSVDLILRQSVENIDTEVFYVDVEVYREGAQTERGSAVVRVNIDRNHAPYFLHGTLNYSIPENQPLTQPFGDVNAADEDTGERGDITYQLVSQSPPGNKNYFFVNPYNGNLSVIAPLTEDSVEEYTLIISATDNARLQKRALVTVRVKILRNNNPPKFSKNQYDGFINASSTPGSPVTQVSATDDDGDAIRYSIDQEGVDQLRFAINPTTGQITLRAKLESESNTEYRFTVRATDTGTPPKHDTAVVIVQVTRNFHKPEFTEQEYNTTISEYHPARRPVITVQATDKDLDAKSRSVVYSILTETKYFYISRGGGQIYVDSELTTPQANDTFVLEVEARDEGIPPRAATTRVVIHVQRNLFAPTADPTVYRSEIVDTFPAGSAILYISATDRDSLDPLNKDE
ncbi:protocadherin Fat 4-like [Liolophura sinensis]|uniref:protocadherin Fat 4-like n=1 Tax=Liolophura sinensis TaxID=3198878 RepID=UPI0031580D7E